MTQNRKIKKKQLFNLNGMQFQLYIILVSFVVMVTAVIGIMQYVTFYNSLKQELQISLQETGRSISAAYASDNYEGTIRSVITSGEYKVRTILEDGSILVDTDDLSYYMKWPDVVYSMDSVVENLDSSQGYFFVELKDSEQTTWVIYGQVIARRQNQREILLVAKSTESMLHQLRRQIGAILKLAAVIVAAAFVVSWYLAKRYLKPIREITDRAQQLSKGDYSVSFPKGSYTEMDALAQVLDQSVEQFAEFEKIRRDMIGNVSHDMRTPLTVIKAYAEMIQTISGDNPEKRNEHLDVIISQADRLSEFVNATLDLNKLASKTVMVCNSKFSLDSLVRKLIEHIQMTDNGEHEFRLYLDESAVIVGDYGRIEQLIYNLVSNAMKYGGGIVEIRVINMEEAVRLEINDYGEGIPQDKLHLIWDRYYMVNPHDRNAGSAGVGLSIVKEIAELHHLEYGVESPEGAGARFWFVFKREP